jgi:peptidoglycan/xylan/chitin deacetylase (PgdA/CDA1 family)
MGRAMRESPSNDRPVPSRIVAPTAMDHDWWDWSPLSRRRVLRWPGGAPLAVCLLVDLGHYEWKPPDGALDAASHTGPMSLNPYPDYPTVTYREYGHRVGIFRVMEVLDRHRVKATVPMDAYTAEHYPLLVEECRRRGWEIAAHGLTQRQAISSRMTEEEERSYIRQSLDAVQEATGTAPLGWLGPEYCESSRTLGLLAEMGVRYVCDIANDEQPYRVKTPTGELYSLPVMMELGDVMMHWNRKVTIERWAAAVREAVDVMRRDGRRNARLLGLNLHPWCIGQAHRIRYLDETLDAILRDGDVWVATGAEIVDAHAASVLSGSTS